MLFKARTSGGKEHRGDEENLVREAQQCDAEAFTQIYEKYFDKIYRYIAIRIRNEMEAEDMTQQVFMKALESIGSFKWQGIPFSAWLYRIAHNQVIDHYRKQNKRATVPIDDLQLEAEDDPQEMVEQRIDAEQVMRASKQLTAAQQEVISLRFGAELPINEVAQVMGKSEGAVKALQHSAVLALRKLLGEGRC